MRGITYRVFLGLGSRAPYLRAACFTGHSDVQNSGICPHSVVAPLEETSPIHMKDTYKILNDDHTPTSGSFREPRLAHKMHVGPLTERGGNHLVDPRFLPVHHRTADVSARFRCSLDCSQDVSRNCCFGVERILYLVSTPTWQFHAVDSPGSPVVIHLHREDADPRIPCLLFLGSLPVASSSLDLVRHTEDPLSAHYSRPLGSDSALTHDPSSFLFENCYLRFQ